MSKKNTRKKNTKKKLNNKIGGYITNLNNLDIGYRVKLHKINRKKTSRGKVNTVKKQSKKKTKKNTRKETKKSTYKKIRARKQSIEVKDTKKSQQKNTKKKGSKKMSLHHELNSRF